MFRKLAPHIIGLTKDACNNAFWYKSDLRIFLKDYRISDNRLNELEHQTKREFIDILFEKLCGLPDNKGHQIILEMAFALSVMTCFPSLNKCDDAVRKIKQAQESVAKLKNEVDKIKNQADLTAIREQSRQQFENMRSKNLQVFKDLSSLKNRLDSLFTKRGTQESGYDFERWFYELAAFFDIEHRSPFRDKDNRQIDGSLTLEGTTFLVELKNTQKPTEVKDIDQFLAKVTCKADNTMGIFVSMAGYTSGAIANASRDKTPIILMDSKHIYSIVLVGVMTLPEVIGRIKRHASQTGEAYLPCESFSH